MKLRPVIYLFVFLFSVMAFSQEESERKTPQIISKIPIGETATLPDGKTTITLTHIESDSRCPIGTTCVWAGEVTFDIAIKHNGNWERKTFKIRGGAATLLQEIVRFDDSHAAFVSGITPKPKAGETIDSSSYTLHFIVKQFETKNEQ